MGKCKYCGQSIYQEEGNESCPNCAENPYACWKCGTEIPYKTEECPICHYYICSVCGCCGEDCDLQIDFHSEQIKGMDERQIILYFYEFFNKKGKTSRCELRNVYHSYAKGKEAKIRKMFLKMNGIGTRTEKDADGFEKRWKEWLNFPIGTKVRVEEIREDGSLGQEWREIMNLAVCQGFARITTGKTEDDKEFNCYERIDIPACEFMNNPEEIAPRKECPSCKNIYENSVTNCELCKSKKGKGIKLVRKKSFVQVCKLDDARFH